MDADKTAPALRSVTAILALLVAGPLVWMLYFVVAYGAHTLICTLGAPENSRPTRVIVIVAAGAALVALAMVADAAPRWRSRAVESHGESAESAAFELYATLLLIVLSGAGVVWTATTAMLVTPCAMLR